MAWIKRNLFFVIGAVVALAFLVGAGFYTLTGLKHNSEQREKLNQEYEELKRLNNLNPHPGSGKVDNISLAGQQEKEIRDFFRKASRRFEPIVAIPDSARVARDDYASALRLTIDQLQREATNNSVVLPPRFSFSFEAQRSRPVYTGPLEPLAVQLGEVKAICDVLNNAKVNSLDSIRRERVSTDDDTGPQTDYLATHSQTNELAVLTPYEITFRCFSPELAGVLTGFANSPHGIVVKSLNVDPAPVSVTDNPVPTPYTPAYVPPPVAPAPISPEGAAAEFARRYGGKAPGVFAPPPVYAAPTAVATAPKGGLPILLNEKQLRVTMLLEIVKLHAKK